MTQLSFDNIFLLNYLPLLEKLSFQIFLGEGKVRLHARPACENSLREQKNCYQKNRRRYSPSPLRPDLGGREAAAGSWHHLEPRCHRREGGRRGKPPLPGPATALTLRATTASLHRCLHRRCERGAATALRPYLGGREPPVPPPRPSAPQPHQPPSAPPLSVDVLPSLLPREGSLQRRRHLLLHPPQPPSPPFANSPPSPVAAAVTALR